MKRSNFLLVVALSFITSFSFGQRTKSLIHQYLKEHRKELKLSASDLKDWEISDQHSDERLGLEYIYINQKYKKAPVFNAMATFVLKDGKPLSKRCARSTARAR